MKAIYKRELKAYFHSFIGFLFIGIVMFFIGLYFTVFNLMNRYPYFSYVLASVLFVFLISVPILTMRALAEEKKQKTDQLILTAPVTVGDIVMGKFLALSTIFLIPIIIICLYPLIMSQFGLVPMLESYLAILAFFLYGESCIAIGLFVSSITESQVIAAVISFGLLFLGYMMSSICGVISSTGNILTRIMGCYDLYTPFYNMVQGTLNLEAIAYYLSFTALILFLTVQSIQKRRYSVSVKKLQAGAYSGSMIVLVLVATIIFNMMVSQIPEGIKNLDISANKLYTLTEDTKKFLDDITEDVTIYVLVSEENQDTTVGKTLSLYQDYSDHITVEYVNPAVNPTFAYQYTSGNINTNSLIVVSDKRSTVVDASNFYESTFDYSTYTSTTTGYDAEGQITSALDYVLNDDISKIYLTQGHGERSLESTFKSALEKANTAYETITLLNYESVPEDASCLILHAPTTDLSKEDVEKIKAYMDAGGVVIAVYGYTDEDMSNYDELLAYMGLEVTEGLVVETNTNNYYFQSQYLLFPNMTYNDITADIYDNYFVFAPYAQGILLTDEDSEEITYEEFLTTSEGAFAKIEYENNTSIQKAEGDVDGPFAIGVSAEKTVGENTATMILYSCDQIFTDNVSQSVSGANLALFMSTLNTYIEGYESKISIPVKSYEISNLVVTGAQVILIGVVTTVVLPLSSLIVGFVIWFKRRKR